MDDCEKSLELISCMIDGELSKQEQELLYAHIANCSSCKNAYEAFSFISNELSENLDAPPPLLAGSIMSKINLEKKTPKTIISTKIKRYFPIVVSQV